MASAVKSVELWVFGIVSGLASLGCCLTLVFLTFNVRYRRLRVLKMSSPNINLLVLGGAFLLYATCLLYGLDVFTQTNLHSATVVCQTRTWLVNFGYTLVFGAMFTKAWRIHRIFKDATVKRVVIKDEKLLLVIGGFLVVDGAIMGCWQAVDPLTAYIRHRTTHDTRTLNSTHPLTGDLDIITPHVYQTCTCTYLPAWLSLLLIYKTAMLLCGTYLAWMIRNVTLPSMNDSRSIISSAYITVILGSVSIALATTFEERPNVSFACASTGILACTTAVQCYIFIPKLRLWQKHKDEEALKSVNMSAQVMSMSRDESVERIEEEMFHLVSENRSLKKSLTEKDTTIQSLQEHVNSAKKKLQHINEDGKQDSGLDVDLSTSSDNVQTNTHMADDVHGQNNNVKRTRTISGTSDWEMRLSVQSKNHVRSRSFASYQIRKLSESIAEDLDVAHTLSCNLRNSISRDLNIPKRVSMCSVYDNARSRELTGSIVDSYDLSDESDTHSYVSSHLGICDFHGNTRHWPNTRRLSYSSCDSEFTINNDTFYPERKQKKRKRSNRWKHQPKPKIYTIQAPQQPHIVGTTGVAMTRNLTDCISEPGTFV